MFKDEVVISVRSGKGGNGCISFRREKFIPKGGPDGGDGGKGGDVVFVLDPHLASLGEYHGNQKFHAQNGRQGSGGKCTGKSGEDLVLTVPKGTIIRDAEHGHILKDLADSKEPFVLLKGGRGGRGNARLASPTEQVPRRAEEGFPGEGRKIVLELKMIADVGIIGLPNAGKSTFLSRISRATPEIADYPFTTLHPQLGVVEFDYRRFVFADLPGLIEGAHLGQGLGDKFLKHVERTRMLLHLIDGRVGEEQGFKKVYSIIFNELKDYSPRLTAKPQIVAITKAETLAEPLDLEGISAEVGQPLHLISSHTGQGLKPLMGALKTALEPQNQDE
jgi:GTP-binding protein